MAYAFSFLRSEPGAHTVRVSHQLLGAISCSDRSGGRDVTAPMTGFDAATDGRALSKSHPRSLMTMSAYDDDGNSAPVTSLAILFWSRSSLISSVIVKSNVHRGCHCHRCHLSFRWPVWIVCDYKVPMWYWSQCGMRKYIFTLIRRGEAFKNKLLIHLNTLLIAAYTEVANTHYTQDRLR